MNRTLRARRDAGFTLIELVIAVALTGFIVAPLSAALVVSLRTSDETASRLAGSNDAQLLSIWLPADIQSVGTVSGSPNPNDDDVVFAPTVNTECSGVSNVLRLRWREPLETTTTFVAAYAVSQASNGTWRLIRSYCINGGTPSTHVVARNLSGSSAVTVTASGSRLSMCVEEAATPTDPSNYVFTVSGHRRTEA